MTQAWSKGTAYADISLDIDRKTGDISGKSAEILTTWADEGPGLTLDPEVARLVEQAKALVKPLTSLTLAQAAAEISNLQNGAGESAMGNLIADAQRRAMNTDFAFMNPGGIRAGFDAGEVTWGEVYTAQPFNNVPRLCDVRLRRMCRRPSPKGAAYTRCYGPFVNRISSLSSCGGY